jgi:ABC-type phosphonate transport system ATPase subunit
MDALERRTELLRGDVGAIHANPFGRLHEVRRRVQAGADAGGAKSALDEGASGPFAVRSRHVDEVQTPLRRPKTLEQTRDPFQA